MRALGRIFSIIFLAALIFAATKSLIRALPGDPLETMMAETGTSIPPEVLRAQLGLDEPLPHAVVRDLGRALHGDFGVSLITGQPIAPILWRRLGKTAILALMTLLISLASSLTVAALAVRGSGMICRAANRFCDVHAAIAAALPTAWIGPALMVVFCVWIPLFPIGDSWILPAITLSISFTGFWSLLLRDRIRDTLQLGFANPARARGIPEWKVILKYGLAPASGALLAYLGTQTGALLGGVFITEYIFDWKGMGMLLIEAVLKRDYPIVEAAAFFTAFFSLLGTALGDWAQSALATGREPE